MAGLKPPAIPEEPVAVLDETALSRLLNCMNGRTFDERRDTAIVRLFLDTGMRLSELAGLKLEDIDLEQDVAIVLGKGRRPRACPSATRLGSQSSATSGSGASIALQGAAASGSGAWSAAGQRHQPDAQETVKAAGIPHLHPHMFRHTFAHRWLAEGGQEQDLMRLAGWRSREPCSPGMAPVQRISALVRPIGA